MAKDLNRCSFIGRLGADPETKYTADGMAISTFNIGCSDDYKKDGEWINKTEWIRFVCFDKLAELVATKLKKGDQVFVSGQMKTRKWQNQEGKNQYSTDIHLADFQLLSSKTEETPKPGGQDKAANNMDDFEDSDIPF